MSGEGEIFAAHVQPISEFRNEFIRHTKPTNLVKLYAINSSSKS